MWISPQSSRKGICCGITITSPPPRCIEFEVTLDENSVGLVFDFYSGAVPTGSMYYMINCGPLIPVGQPICLDGVGPHTLTFCKPGNNPNEYYIRAIPKNIEVQNIATREDCPIDLEVNGIRQGTAIFKDITGGGLYESYLSCTSYCDTIVTFSPPIGAPSQIQYQVCGETSLDICSSLSVIVCDTVTIDISPDFEITVSNTDFCESETQYPMEVFTSIPTYNYSYKWMSAANGTGNILSNNSTYAYNSIGNYSVIVTDTDYPTCSQKIINFSISLIEEHHTYLTDYSCNPSDTGTANINLLSSQGCDSTVIVTTKLLPTFTHTFYKVTCDKNNIGTVVTIYNSEHGCDSTVYQINYLPPNDTTLYGFSCNPSDTGTTVQTVSNFYGCDSTITTIIGLLPTQSIILNETICQGKTFTTSGVTHSTTGIYIYNFQTYQGCDSTVTLNLTVLDTNVIYLTTYSCNSVDVGTTTQTFQNQNGCDSLVITTTTLLNSDTTYSFSTSCDANLVGIITQTFQNQNGCDSLVITTTTLLNSDTTYSLSTSCDANQVGIVTQTFQNQNGCDSLVITTTTLLNSDTTYSFSMSCDANLVGTTTQNLQNQNGCDSLVITTTTLLASALDTTYLQSTTCDLSSAGVFMTMVSNQNGCDSILVEIVEYFPIPPIFVEDIDICEGETVVLSVTGGDGSYNWFPATGLSCTDCPNPIVTPSETTTYTVSSMSCLGVEQVSMTVNVIQNPMITIGQSEEVINLGDSAILWATTNQVLTNLNWFTLDGEIICSNCSEITVAPTITTSYLVTATNDIGCEVSENLTVIVNQTCPDATVEAPNLMTPNGDGANDVFDIRYTGLKDVTVLRIYNRWGQKVFETTDLSIKWDGTFREESVDAGVFIYYFKAICPNGDERIYKGNVTLVR